MIFTIQIQQTILSTYRTKQALYCYRVMFPFPTVSLESFVKPYGSRPYESKYSPTPSWLMCIATQWDHGLVSGSKLLIKYVGIPTIIGKRLAG